MHGNRRVPFAAAGAALAALAAVAIYFRAAPPAGGTATQDARAATRPIEGGAFEASAVVSVPTGNGALFVDDSRPQEIFWMELGADGMQKGPAQRVPLGIAVVDPEGLTTDGDFFYVVGSQSKPEGLQGAGLIRFRFDPARRAADRVEAIPGLKALLIQRIPEFSQSGSHRNADGFDIEGLAWDPAHRRLLLGMRAPLVDGQAVVVPMKLRDPQGAFTAENLQADGPVLRVPLGGAGIRSLEYNAARGAFMIIAGPAPTSGGAFRLVDWTNGTVREVARFPASLKPEGVTRLTLDGAEATLVVFDTSRLMVIR